MRSLVLALLASAALSSGQTQQPQWRFVWGDEFEGAAGSKPDPANWTYDLGGGGWGNDELQTYTDSAANAFLDGEGRLVIRVIRTADGGYTSARLKTLGKLAFRYGKIEARLKLPAGNGLWPAFWSMGEDFPNVVWPKGGEIDFMENVGKEPQAVHSAVHGPGFAGGSVGFRYTFPNPVKPTEDFHVYAAEWLPDRITFLVDDVVYGFVIRENLPPEGEWVFDKPYFLLLNLAIGGSWPGLPDSTTVFPQDFVIDWVRVWQQPTDAAAATKR